MSLNIPNDNNLYIDSGVTNHMVQSISILINSSTLKGSNVVMVGDGTKLLITHIENKNIKNKGCLCCFWSQEEFYL